MLVWRVMHRSHAPAAKMSNNELQVRAPGFATTPGPAVAFLGLLFFLVGFPLWTVEGGVFSASSRAAASTVVSTDSPAPSVGFFDGPARGSSDGSAART